MNAPYLVLFVPGSGRRLEIMGWECAEGLANLLRERWLNTMQVRVTYTDKGREGEGVP